MSLCVCVCVCVSMCMLHLGPFLAQNNIPVFCPALTDGSLGDMLYLHSYRNPGLRVDIVEGGVRGN